LDFDQAFHALTRFIGVGNANRRKPNLLAPVRHFQTQAFYRLWKIL
jgi:hypothetical protein